VTLADPKLDGKMQVDPMESEIRMKNDGESRKLESDLESLMDIDI